jgi:hypothetical protein
MLIAQLTANRQRWHHMPARATSGDHHPQRDVFHYARTLPS